MPVVVVVAFNIALVVLAASAAAPIGTPSFLAWFVGDFALSLLALALTER
jgi:hypothetical protein